MLESNIGTGPNNYVQLTASGELPITIDVGDLTDTGGLLTHADTSATQTITCTATGSVALSSAALAQEAL